MAYVIFRCVTLRAYNTLKNGKSLSSISPATASQWIFCFHLPPMWKQRLIFIWISLYVFIVLLKFPNNAIFCAAYSYVSYGEEQDCFLRGRGYIQLTTLQLMLLVTSSSSSSYELRKLLAFDLCTLHFWMATA